MAAGPALLFAALGSGRRHPWSCGRRYHRTWLSYLVIACFICTFAYRPNNADLPRLGDSAPEIELSLNADFEFDFNGADSIYSKC